MKNILMSCNRSHANKYFYFTCFARCFLLSFLVPRAEKQHRRVQCGFSSYDCTILTHIKVRAQCIDLMTTENEQRVNHKCTWNDCQLIAQFYRSPAVYITIPSKTIYDYIDTNFSCVLTPFRLWCS